MNLAQYIRTETNPVAFKKLRKNFLIKNLLFLFSFKKDSTTLNN